ncbi:MAG: S26 family signal peptidase [Hyphomonadaceae bacterium]|nr:S26 family signal peptidase [Hyphomonadaceae bacterium]
MNRKRGTIGPLAAGASAVAALAVASGSSADVVLFNHSPSIPTGFYLRTASPIEVGEVVTVRARDVALVEATRRHYASDGDRFIKRVAAIAGQDVCSDGQTLQIDGAEAAHVFVPIGREAPQGWVGCRRLASDEILLLGDSADSFDGRYWGPVSASLVEGVWRPL